MAWQCRQRWMDAKGHSHECSLDSSHISGHICGCGQSISYWMMNYGAEALTPDEEDQEEERLRLRDALKSLQEGDDEHVSPDELDDYVHGRLPAEDDDRVIDHLSRCERCNRG